jgi:hypothetical protein
MSKLERGDIKGQIYGEEPFISVSTSSLNKINQLENLRCDLNHQIRIVRPFNTIKRTLNQEVRMSRSLSRSSRE